VRSTSATVVELEVRDILPPYDLVRADGTATHQSGRGARSWHVTLRRATGGGARRIDTIAAG